MLGKGLLLKTTALLVFFLWSVKSLKNLQIIELFIISRNVAFFLTSSMVLGLLNQQQICRRFCLAELLGLLTGLVLLKLYVALDISKAFDRVWHAGLLHKLKSYGISGQIFGLISSFLSNRLLCVFLDGKSSQEYPVNAGVPQGSVLGPTLFLLYINDLPDDVISNIAIYADDTTLYTKCDQTSDLWQQLVLASELESDLLWTLAGSGLLISVLEKLN